MKITDKMRLDFIEREEAEINCDLTDKREKWFVDTDPTGLGSEGPWKPTLRQAIDAAIRAEKKK